MLYLNLMGGLGNQMSQLAYAYIVAKQNDDNKILIYSEWFSKHSIRKCSIHKFKLDNNIVFSNKKSKMKYKLARFLYHAIVNLFFKEKQVGKKIFYKLSQSGYLYSFDSSYYGVPIVKKKNIDIYGYFLAAECFEPYKRELKQLFLPRPEFVGTEMKKYLEKIRMTYCPISMSLRLQDDYIKNNANNVCSKEFFSKAINKIKVLYPNSCFFVFADDIERAKKFLNTIEVEAIYIENCSDVEQLFIMWECKHYIISNSSFSWWGAYLSHNETKTVIAPSKWMNNKIDYSSKYYSGIIKIDV